MINPCQLALKALGLEPSAKLDSAELASPAEHAAFCDRLARLVHDAAERLRASGLSPAMAVEKALSAALLDPKQRFVLSMSTVSRTLLVASSFSYPDLRDILGACVDGRHLWKRDARSYFYVFRTDAATRALCCTRLTRGGATIVVQLGVAVMGARPSCSIATAGSALVVHVALVEHFEAASSSLGWQREGLGSLPPTPPESPTAEAYVDDDAGAGTAEAAADIYGRVGALLEAADVALADGPGKQVPPTTSADVIGYRVDLAAGTVCLPAPKAAQFMLHAFLLERLLLSATLRGAVSGDLVRTVGGQLGHWAQLQPAGEAHLHSFHAAANLSVPPGGLLRPALLRDLAWWRERLLAGELAPSAMLRYDSGRAVMLLGSDAGDDALAGEVMTPRGYRAVRRVGPPSSRSAQRGRCAQAGCRPPFAP